MSDLDSPQRTGSNRRRRVFLAVSGVLVVALLIAARSVLMPFILGAVVAYVLLPAVRRVERLKIPRWVAILLVYAVTLGTIAGFFSLMVPRLSMEARGIAADWPRFQEKARAEWLPAVDAKLSAWTGRPIAAAPKLDDLGPPPEPPPPFKLVKQPDGSFDVRIAEGVQFREKRDGLWQVEQVDKQKAISSFGMLRDGFDKVAGYAQENSGEIIRIGRELVAAVSRGVFTLFMTLMLGGYMMLTHEKILRFFKSLARPESRESFERFVGRLDRGLSGVVRGQLMICLVNGVLSAIGFAIFGLKYWPILALVAAVMSVIPIFGSILSSVPAVCIGLTQSPAIAVGVLAWIIGIHQLEANFLNPKIIGDAAKIHPVLVVFSLIVGEHFFQLAGALFAVPVLSIAQTVFLHFRESSLGIPADSMSSGAGDRSSKAPPKRDSGARVSEP